MKAQPARPSASMRCLGLGALATAAVLALAAPGFAQDPSRAPLARAPAPGEILIDTSVLDQLGRDPYGRAAPPSPAAQQRKPQLKAPRPAAPASSGLPAPADWAPAPHAAPPAGGLLPPPGPGELERRQAQINAALGRVQPTPAATPAAAPPKPAAPAKPVAKSPATAAKKPAPSAARPPSAAPATPVTAAPAYQLPQFQQPAYQPPTGTMVAPAVPPLPGSSSSAAAAPPPMAPPTPPPAAFTPPLPPTVSPVPTAASAPPPASVPMAAAPTPIAPAAKGAAGQAPSQATQVRAAPAPGAAPAAPPAGQTAARPPKAEPAPPFVPSGKSVARVTFLSGSSDLPENAKPGLKSVAEQMSRDSEMRVQLLAFAGPREDTASQARRLSLFRALAVRSYLIEQGIRSARMDVRAMGNKFDEEPGDRVDVVIADR